MAKEAPRRSTASSAAALLLHDYRSPIITQIATAALASNLSTTQDHFGSTSGSSLSGTNFRSPDDPLLRRTAQEAALSTTSDATHPHSHSPTFLSRKYLSGRSRGLSPLGPNAHLDPYLDSLVPTSLTPTHSLYPALSPSRSATSSTDPEEMKRSYHRMTSKLISKVFDHTSLNEIPLSTPHHKSAHVVSPTASFFDDMDHHTTPSSPIKRLSQRFIFPGSPSSTDDESYSFNSSDTESHDEPAEHVEVQRPSLENQPVDYFSYKAQSYYPSPKTFETDATLGADHTQRLAPPTPSGPLTGSYWSPLNTPAPPPASTDSYHSPTNTPIPASEAASSPSAIAPFAPPPSSLPWRRARDLWQPNLPSTPEGDPFPYIAYESTYARDMIATQLSAFRLIAATPTPPLVLTPPATRPSRPSRRVTAPTIGLLSPQALDSGTGTVATPTPALHDDDEITIKVYFAHTSDLVKFRCRRRDTHLSDFVLTVATRMPTGWEALYAAKDPVGWGAGVKDIERACINNRARMIKLSKDVQWRWWFKECMDGGVKRLILWAM